MRTQIARLAMLSLFFAGCAEAQTPVVVADGRAYPELVTAVEADADAWASQPALRQAAEAARAHWRARDSDYEEEFRVMGVAQGAFSEAGAEQYAVLYLMSLWPRAAPKMGIALVQDGQLIQNLAFDGIAQNIAALPDLDGDGRDELAFSSSFGMGGHNSTSVLIASFGEEGLADWGSAPLVEDACAAMQEGSTAARVSVGPGPVWTIERFTKPTCDADTWQAEGAAEPLALEGGGTRYVDLAIR